MSLARGPVIRAHKMEECETRRERFHASLFTDSRILQVIPVPTVEPM